MPLRAPHASLLLLSALLALSACRREQPSHPTPAAASEGAPAAQVDPQGRPILGGAPTNEAEAAAQRLAQAGGDRGEPKPVYPAVAQADPLADRLCEALHTVPARRRADCCEQKTTGYLVTADCVATLSAALAAEGLTLSESSVAACEKAMAEAHAGCGWVGPFPARVPAACDGVFVGALGAGERCRSALECAPGLACRGLAPTTVGVCAPPARRGRACQTGIDPLAALTRQEGTSAAHPECEGFCARHLCQDATPLGEPCQTNLQCGPEAHCEGGTCQPGAEAAEGAACIDGGCPRDTRCIDKTCQKPKPKGDPCQSDAQCQGGCLKPPDATEGQCGTRCKAPFLP